MGITAIAGSRSYQPILVDTNVSGANCGANRPFAKDKKNPPWWGKKKQDNLVISKTCIKVRAKWRL